MNPGKLLTPPGVSILIAFIFLAGCAAPLQSVRLSQSIPDELSTPVELTSVPFNPQERYQCGPAALATLLQWRGVEISADELVPEVFVPGREGSLQLEMVAAARRHDRVPLILPPDVTALLTEVKAGNPVLVLQNLGLSWYPRWHYAVVVGFDMEGNQLVLRSGTEQRHIVSLTLFERTWRRGGYWAAVILNPDQPPVTVDEVAYLRAVLAFEQAGNGLVAAKGYRTAIRSWPQSVAAWFGLGNTLYQMGNRGDAERAYSHALGLDASYAPALNNLAWLLAERGDLSEAERLAVRAVEIGGVGAGDYERTLIDIRQKLEQRQ